LADCLSATAVDDGLTVAYRSRGQDQPLFIHAEAVGAAQLRLARGKGVVFQDDSVLATFSHDQRVTAASTGEVFGSGDRNFAGMA
jgi:hypothetical protein